MIRQFAHKGLERFFTHGSKAKINPQHAPKLQEQLSALSVASSPKDMNIPGWDLHLLNPKEKGEWAISVNGNWRVTFKFEGTDVIQVDYQDYH